MFLTDIDSRAAIRGSRDPLGLVPVWGSFGRRVVGNLTTVTGSVRGFTTTLLGYYFAREVQEREGGKAESTLVLFLKFEQLAAYCRYHVKKDGEFRGVERVKKVLAGGDVVTLSARTEDQILSNQKVYGLWGLFSVASRASGLLERDEGILTSTAREFVERQYLALLSKEGFRDGREVVDCCGSRGGRSTWPGSTRVWCERWPGSSNRDCRRPSASSIASTWRSAVRRIPRKVGRDSSRA